MTDPTLPTGPDPEAIAAYLMTTYPDTDLVQAMHAWFFSLDPERHFPNYATIVTTDEHDAQRYLAILNPSDATWREVVIPLLTIAHDRLAAQRARHDHDARGVA